MNEMHLKMCSSAEWAEAIERWIIPWVLESVELGDDVIEVGARSGTHHRSAAFPVQRLTAVELDDDLAPRLRSDTPGTNVDVVHGDATCTSLEDDRFSGAVCLTMLHIYRVLNGKMPVSRTLPSPPTRRGTGRSRQPRQR